ncbi:MAG: hypothetical protein HDT40_11070 [Lachnospiraceae bacterium]|nr:hypothetical protein [Lachnospiraceae bacterium]
MRKKIVAVILTIIICLNMPINSYAAKSDATEKHFANVVLFAHFKGDTGAAKYFEDNSAELIRLYDGSQGRSVTNYLNTISYGKFHLKNIFPQYKNGVISSYELPYDENYYKGNADAQIISAMIQDIGATSEVVDYDGDGYIDNLTIILLGGSKADADDSDSSIYVCHKSDYPGAASWSGKRIGTYNVLNTYSILGTDTSDKTQILSAGSGVIAHEFLHSLGYPDLYRNGVSDVNDVPVYTWDIMAAVSSRMSYPLAYTRMYFTNWLDIETITESQSITLHEQSNPDGNQAYIIKSPLNDDEFFVVEFRKQGDKYNKDYTVSEDTLDAGIAGSGIIVYRIDTTVEALSNHYGKTGIYVFRPSAVEGTDNSELALVSNAFLSKESGRTSIGSGDMSATLSDGALTFSDGTNSGIVISDVSSSAGSSMTCTVTIPKEENFDLWKDTGLTDLTGGGTSTSKTMDIENYGGRPFVVSASGKNIYSQVYNGSTWTQLGGAVSLNQSMPIQGMELLVNGSDLYLGCYGWGYLELRKWNSTASTWVLVATATNVNSDRCGFMVYDNSIYATIVSEDSESARLVKLQGNAFQECGTYFTGGFCGQPNICSINNKLYVSVRRSTGDKIMLYQYNGVGSFTGIDNPMSSNTYDMAAYGNKIYFALGKSGSSGLSIYEYDGVSWKSIDSGLSSSFPKLAVVQGKFYVLTATTGTRGRIRLYAYNDNTGTFVQEGTDVDSSGSASEIYVTSTSDNIFVVLKKSTDGKLVVKNKQTVTRLLSIEISAPSKTTYYQGDAIDLTGLKVVATYSDGKREIPVSSCTVKGFDTKTIGKRTATVEYEGFSATFSYEVAAKPEIQGTTVYNGVDYSAVYNYSYYITKYPDIKKAFGSDDKAALAHFVNCGMKEGRQAKADFNVYSYAYKYADLRNAYKNNLKSYYMHYVNYGKRENRVAVGTTGFQNYCTVYNGVDYSAVYDCNYYVNKYKDIKNAFNLDDAKILAHFVNCGMKEGRQGSAGFEVMSYAYKYADLRNVYKNDLKKYYVHYINYGKKEGRIATGTTSIQNCVTKYNGKDYSAVYNGTYYASKYSDIRKAYGLDDAAMLRHFINYGMKEGRQGSQSFNVSNYRNRYADLKNAFGNDLTKYYMHYINYGVREGRNGK